MNQPTGTDRKGKTGSRPLFIPLRVKLALSFSLLLILLSGVVAFAIMSYERVFLTREGEKRSLSLAGYLAVNSREPLLESDDLRLGEITESVLLGGDVRYAYLVDHDGNMVYHSDLELAGFPLVDGQVPEPGREVIQSVAAVEIEGVRVGTAVVGLSADYIDKALETTLKGLLFPLLFATVAGVVGIFLLSGFHIRRIEKLEEAITAVGMGDLLTQVDVHSRDEVGRLAAHFNSMVASIREARDEVERNFTETISALAAAVEAKDAYTRGHCERVAKISKAIALRMGVNSGIIRDLELAAILHDVGKIGVQEEIIGKEGPLEGREKQHMNLHPEIGARILSSMSSLNQVGFFVRHHHEHYDGSGYPDGLAGDAIPVPSRIINLVDAFDAMTSDRSYRPALPVDEAVERIREGGGSQFDPAVVAAFIELRDSGVIDQIRHDVEDLTG